MSEVGHQLDDMLADCEYQKVQCTPRNFTQWVSLNHIYLLSVFLTNFQHQNMTSFVICAGFPHLWHLLHVHHKPCLIYWPTKRSQTHALHKSRRALVASVQSRISCLYCHISRAIEYSFIHCYLLEQQFISCISTYCIVVQMSKSKLLFSACRAPQGADAVSFGSG